MHYSEELYQQTREEMSRLKSELKAFNKSRAELTDPAEKERPSIRLAFVYSADHPARIVFVLFGFESGVHWSDSVIHHRRDTDHADFQLHHRQTLLI